MPFLGSHLQSFPRAQENTHPQSQKTHDQIALAFIILQLFAACGLSVILLTAALSRNVKRYSTWFSFIGSWVFSCICYSLLALAGQRTRPDPDFGLCITQMALIYTVPSLTACTTLALSFHMLLNLRRLMTNVTFRTNSGTVVAFLIVPYIIGVIEFIGIFLFGYFNPETVEKSANGTYCHSANRTLSKISSMVVVCCSVLIVAIQGMIATKLYKKRGIISRSGQSFTMVVRVMVFSLLGALALGAGVAHAITVHHDQPFDMILACVPVLATIVFGSQLDLVYVWICHKKRTSSIEKPLMTSTQ